MVFVLAAVLLIVGLLLAAGAPRLARWHRVSVRGPWLHPRQLTRTGQHLMTIHLELTAAFLVTMGGVAFAPGVVGDVLKLTGAACFLLNIAMAVLVTLPLTLVGVAAERRP